jgi:plastocyanin
MRRQEKAVRINLVSGLSAGVVLAIASACGGSGTATPAPQASTPAAASAAATASCKSGLGTGQQVAIANFAFTPPTTTVSSGSTVTWTNGDSTDHTVTFDGGPDCGHLATAASATVTFPAAGTYNYHCTIHPSMKGTVTVS